MNNSNYHSRLIEYFAVVGLGEEAILKRSPSNASQEIDPCPSHWDVTNTLAPQVLDRFPPVDHSESPFPNGATLFCFPSGICLEEQMKLPQYFHFVLTGGSGERLYGYALIIYEPASAKQLQLAQQKLEGYSTDKMRKPHYVPKCLCLLSYWPYLNNYRTFLTLLYRLSLSGGLQPIEQYISNFVLEVPVPLPNVQVQLRMAETDLLFNRPPKNNPISWIDLPFQQVFECLSIPNIVQVVTCLLCERPVLIQSSQLSLLAGTAEVLLALIYPFTWNHVYIPVLPENLLMVLQAPLPYLVGVHSSILTRAYRDNNLITSDTTLHVDLDINFVSYSRSFPIPKLPDHDAKKLVARLTQCCPAFERRGADWETSVLPYLDCAVQQVAPPSDPSDRAQGAGRTQTNTDSEFRLLEDGGCNWRMARVAFFRLLISLLRGFREFISTTGAKGAQECHFDSKGFVEKQKSKDRHFFTSLVHSQHFLTFMDNRLYSSDEAGADMVFFDQSLDAKLNRSIVNKVIPGSKSDTPFLENSENSVTKTIVVRGVDPDDPVLPHSLTEPEVDFEIFNPDQFPRLNPGWFELTEKASMARLKANSVALDPGGTRRDQRTPFQKGKTRENKQLQIFVADALDCPEEAILASWFVLFCSAIGQPTPVSQRAEEVAARDNFVAFIGSPSSPRALRAMQRPQSMRVLRKVDHAIPMGSENNSNSFTPTRFARSATFSSGLNCDAQGHKDAKAAQRPCSTRPRCNTAANHGSLGFQTQKYHDTECGENSRDEWRKELWEAMLQIAFEVATATLECGVQLNEVVFRVLISACGKCGDLDHALQVLGMMHDAGMRPDSVVYANLVQAFSMNSSSNSIPQLDMLNWDHVRQHVREASRRILASEKKKKRFKIPTRYKKKQISIKRWDNGSLASPPMDRRHSLFEGSLATFANAWRKPPNSSSVMDAAKVQLKKSTLSWSVHRFWFGESDPASPAQDFPERLPGELGRPQESGQKGSDLGDVKEEEEEGETESELDSMSLTVSIPMERGEHKHLDGLLVEDTQHINEVKSETDAEKMKKERKQSKHRSHHGKVEQMNMKNGTSRSSELHLATPSASLQKLSLPQPSKDLKELSLSQPSNDLKELSLPQPSKDLNELRLPVASKVLQGPQRDSKPETPKSDFSIHDDSLFQGTVLDALFPGLKVSMDSEVCPGCAHPLTNQQVRSGWQKDPQDYNTTCPSCSKRFVAFFTVSCDAGSDWQGSTGPDTPLYCEFLPPWVLVKEVQAVLMNKGIEFICSEGFRATRSTLFWNLMVYFGEFSLPVEFLVGFILPHELSSHLRSLELKLSPRAHPSVSLSTLASTASSVCSFDENELAENVQRGSSQVLRTAGADKPTQSHANFSEIHVTASSQGPPTPSAEIASSQSASQVARPPTVPSGEEHESDPDSQTQERTVVVPEGSYATPTDLSSVIHRRSGDHEEIDVPSNLEIQGDGANKKVSKGRKIFSALARRFKK